MTAIVCTKKPLFCLFGVILKKKKKHRNLPEKIGCLCHFLMVKLKKKDNADS